MHYPETIFFQLCAEVAGKLDAIKVKILGLFPRIALDLTRAGVMVDPGGGVNRPGKCTISGGRLQDGSGKVLKVAEVIF